MRSILTSTERARPAYRLPGLSLRAAVFVVDLAGQHFPDWDRPTGRPSALSMVDAGRLTLCRLRRTATYQDLHADVGIGKTTAWDYHQKIVNFLAEVLDAEGEDSLSALVAGRVCLVEGTLVPSDYSRPGSACRSSVIAVGV